jgi:hypothetical protein
MQSCPFMMAGFNINPEEEGTGNSIALYRNLQPPFFFLFLSPLIPLPRPPALVISLSSSSRIATIIAVSKISSTPMFSLDEHSIYRAPMRCAIAMPCSGVTGVRPWVLRRSMQVFLWRRSDFRPRRIKGVVGQKWRTSGYHCFRLLLAHRVHLSCESFTRGAGKCKCTNDIKGIDLPCP